MSISDSKRIHSRNTLITYLCVTLFCVLFSAVYEHFSHGVYSDYMVYLALFPLLAGLLPYAVVACVRELRFPGRAAANLYNSGVAALTVASCLSGVFEIYGTSSKFTPVFWVAGAAFCALGLLFYLVSLHRKPR